MLKPSPWIPCPVLQEEAVVSDLVGIPERGRVVVAIKVVTRPGGVSMEQGTGYGLWYRIQGLVQFQWKRINCRLPTAP